jgi:hypothetical protein
VILFRMCACSYPLEKANSRGVTESWSGYTGGVHSYRFYWTSSDHLYLAIAIDVYTGLVVVSTDLVNHRSILILFYLIHHVI